jgi:hypothetical protein
MKKVADPIKLMYSLPYKIFVFCVMIPAGVALIMKGFEGINQGFIIGGAILVLQIPWLQGLKHMHDHKNDEEE